MSWPLTLLFSFLALVFLLHMLATVLPPTSAPSRYASFFARLIYSWFTLLACAFYGVFASAALQVAGYGGLGQWTTGRAFKYAMWFGAGVRVEVVRGEQYLSPWYAGTDEQGNEVIGERRARVLVGNHQTELDVLILGCIFPKYTSVTAKKSLRLLPFLGQFMSLSKTVFIDRANRASALSAFDSAAKTMQAEKQSVFIFPEGTRSYAETPMLLPFKKGAFHLAVQAQVDIVPVVSSNYTHVLNVKKRWFRGGVVPVSVLKPIPTKGLEAKDVDALCTKVRDLMLEELLRLDVEIKGKASGHANGGTIESEKLKAEQRKAATTGTDVFKGVERRL